MTIETMKYYKRDGIVHAFKADGSQDSFIERGMVKMTDYEVDRHVHPEKYLTAEEKREMELGQMMPLTRRQFRLVLVSHGISLSMIEEKIMTIEDDVERQMMMIEWEDAQTFERNSSSLNKMALLLGMNDDQVSALWEKALTL